MRIASFEVFPVALPFRRPYATATGTLTRREMLLVRIGGGDGTPGWGDAVPLSLRGGPALEAVAADLYACAGVLDGFVLAADATAAAQEALSACRRAGAGPQAISAVDIALLDLLGKRDGVPAWRLLGASAPERIACNATIGADDAADAADAAAKAVRAGFETIKVKAGDGRDVDRIRSVRAAAGPAPRLRIDANGCWDVAVALERLHALEAVGLELAEQPGATLADLAAIRSGTEVPVVADESVTDVAEAEAAVRLQAIDAATLKLAKVGGPRAALAIDSIAPAYLSSALDSVVGVAAAAHTAVAMESRGFAAGRAHGLATSPLFAENVADDSAFRGPEIDIGSEPGLGVEPTPGSPMRPARR